MKTRFLLFTVLTLCAVSLRADELPWQDDYAKTLAEAAEKHQPILLDFSASWCGPCRMMEATTFADAKVREEMKGYVLVKVDLDQARDLAAHYRVEAIPTCILLNQFGEKVDEHVGYVDAAKFAAWLHKNEDEAFARESQAEIQQAAIQRAIGNLEGKSETDRMAGLEFLLSTYGGPDSRASTAGKSAADELRAWAGRHPDRAMPLLNERRLAVRLFFASVFAEKLGAGLQFDPWDTAPARKAALARVAMQIGEGH